ncbi:hypothetical protein Nepgr_026117 [Nepenthes gracilis]|uniref:Uncharacterized protein n=1 Tax=Nepenthes gracilis TaxID=150966 RepID=A0AAD3T8C5_NEPGR|nr:hypothetical protein Nepgr_026117 [Nepenthes gracilis]
MENLRDITGETNPYPACPIGGRDDEEFEFGCIKPSSPTGDPNKSSPADQFFLNGKLLPHSFPAQTRIGASDASRATSRTSSVSSKDSLLWSRSNSTNSRSSNCSSARTSSSEALERKMVQISKVAGGQGSNGGRTEVNLGQKQQDRRYKYQHGSSQRWQFITAAPVLDPSLSRRRRSSSAEFRTPGALTTPNPKKKAENSGEKGSDERCGFWQRVLRSAVATCKACHAIDRTVEDVDCGRQSWSEMS